MEFSCRLLELWNSYQLLVSVNFLLLLDGLTNLLKQKHFLVSIFLVGLNNCKYTLLRRSSWLFSALIRENTLSSVSKKSFIYISVKRIFALTCSALVNSLKLMQFATVVVELLKGGVVSIDQTVSLYFFRALDRGNGLLKWSTATLTYF